MPKAPITYRETFFTEVRGGQKDAYGTPQIRQLDWNRVETELGTMIEPHNDLSAPDISGKVTQVDMTDAAVSKISMIDESAFYTQFGTAGPANPIDFNA